MKEFWGYLEYFCRSHSIRYHSLSAQLCLSSTKILKNTIENVYTWEIYVWELSEAHRRQSHRVLITQTETRASVAFDGNVAFHFESFPLAKRRPHNIACRTLKKKHSEYENMRKKKLKPENESESNKIIHGSSARYMCEKWKMCEYTSNLAEHWRLWLLPSIFNSHILDCTRWIEYDWSGEWMSPAWVLIFCV